MNHLVTRGVDVEGRTCWSFQKDSHEELSTTSVCSGVLPPALVDAWCEELSMRDSTASTTASQPWKRYHWLPLEGGEPPERSGLVAQTFACVRERLRAAYPQTFEAGLASVAGLEFWTQLRPLDAPLQLHWDVDEELGQWRGEAACPWISVVCYLTSAGGPTIVLDQRPGDAWGRRVRHQLVWPTAGSILCFPGELL
eukprot:3715829-Prymnesium_polylepis.1